MTSPHSFVPGLIDQPLRRDIRQRYLASESQVVAECLTILDMEPSERARVRNLAIELVRGVRKQGDMGVMELFLGEYGLTSEEGIALMCLAEALLRVPDAETIDDLIEDKISHGNWGRHLGHSDSPLVNASTWALLLTGHIISEEDEPGIRSALRGLIKRLGEPVVRVAVSQAMKELGRQFVLGTTIDKAMERARDMQEQGYRYSYDMLGEAARTEADARRYHLAYSNAIAVLSRQCTHEDIRHNPGISVKLSALHPRYEFGQYQRVIDELVPRVASLAQLARSANMGFNIDAEEADRLDLSLDIIERVLSNPALAGWHGFGVVVQAYGRRALNVLDWLYQLSDRLDRNIMVRLVKGAYWDSEIKRAQVLGLEDYPVFTRKVNTDVAYLACARKLVAMSDRIYAQFATHNAHSVAAVLEMTGGGGNYEFQRLHGMGEALHELVRREHGSACRIYAPVGAHQDLLAYLVRRLLENGANSSFVNQIVDESISPESIARDPVEAVEELGADIRHPAIPLPEKLYGDSRRGAKGWDITDVFTLQQLYPERQWYHETIWRSGFPGETARSVTNPANPADVVGEVNDCGPAEIDHVLDRAAAAFDSWAAKPVQQRTECLQRIADAYEANAGQLFALLAREAGKTWLDAVGEVREAVDFARYYADQAKVAADQGDARGIIACISPWNFPLAIFSGQVFAALVTGNCVVAKPAEQTCLVAAYATQLMHEAGVPAEVMQLAPGKGSVVGAALVSDARVSGVCFTGSTATALHIHRNMAEHLHPGAPLIAETGGLNAMVVDSTALPEQVVRDVLASAFQSAGQRCSALRLLYLQEDVADRILEMLFGAMDELALGDPWLLSTDIGPVIDTAARDRIRAYCEMRASEGRVLKSLVAPEQGLFIAPTVIELEGMFELEEEIFGPVLHVAKFPAERLDQVVDDINAVGYGLTFGMHTRVDSRVRRVVERIQVGNIYINRNQIGAVVGSQPFGGEGLSGTGPKAGGPHYLGTFRTRPAPAADQAELPRVDAVQLRQILSTAPAYADCLDPAELEQHARLEGVELNCPLDMSATQLPGPTGETNQLSLHPRGRVLCLGPGPEAAMRQAVSALAGQNVAILICEHGEELADSLRTRGFEAYGCNGQIDTGALSEVDGFAAVLSFAREAELRRYHRALAARTGLIIPLICDDRATQRLVIERHLCIDTTASGGNASLIAVV